MKMRNVAIFIFLQSIVHLQFDFVHGRIIDGISNETPPTDYWDVTEESTVTESTEITEETTDWSTDSSTKFPDWPPLTDNATHPDVEITTPQNDIVPEKKPRPHDYQWMVLAVVFIVLTLGTSSAAIFVLLITPSGALALK